MPFVLRREGDLTNPQLVRVFGEQSTTGLLCYYTKIGNQTAFIVFLGEGEKYGEGEFDSILWYRYGGQLLTPYDPVTGLGDYILHRGTLSTGFDDPLQGRPTFFPDLDFTFSGKAYVEVKLPVALSDGTDEPTRSEIRVRGSRIKDYDADGAEITGNYGASANNLRMFLYCMKLGRKLTAANIATRIDWPYYAPARAKCDAGIAWAAGGGDGLTGNYYSDEFTTLALTRVDSQISFAFGTGQEDIPAVPFTVRWSGFIEAPVTGTYRFSAVYDDGVKLTVDSTVLIDDLGVGPARESSGEVALTAGTKYAIQIDYSNAVNTGELTLSYECGNALPKQVIPRERLFSTSGIADDGRIVTRHRADLVFPGTPLPTALAQIMSRCPGIEWQEVNGKIRFLSDTNRASVFTFFYDPTQTETPSNIVAKSVTGSPRDPLTKPNFLIIGYRDRDDELLTQKYVPIDRPALRDRLNGQLVDPGIRQIGVASQSEAERVGESIIRLNTDLDLDVAVSGQKGSHKVAKADRVSLVHVLGDWRGTAFAGHSGPIDMLVDTEQFDSTIETANEKTYGLIEYDPDYYSDDAHGELIRKRIVDAPSPYARPPVVELLELSQFAAELADGSFSITIEGQATAAVWGYEQRLRLWWQRPANYIGALTVDHALNKITTPIAHQFSANQPVELIANGGTLPDGTNDNIVYYAQIVSSTAIRLLLKPDGAPVDLLDAGAGAFMLAPYYADDKLLIPNRTTRQTSFELAPAEVGTHKIRLVAESLLQQHYAISVSTAATIATTMPATEQPALLLGTFDYVVGDLLVEWPEEEEKYGRPNVYDLELNYDDANPDNVRHETITPSLNRTLQEFVMLDPSSYDGLGPPTDSFTLLADGGASIFAGNSLRSAAVAGIIGGLLVRFIIPARNYLPMRTLVVFPASSGAPSADDSFMWTTGGSYPNFTATPEHDFYDSASPSIPITSGMSLDIFFRADGVVEYHFNYGPFSRPVWISGKRTDPSVGYRVYVAGPGRVESILWQRQGPEYKYIALAQREDFELISTDPLPDEIAVRVRKRSPYTNGPPSDWTEELFVRP